MHVTKRATVHKRSCRIQKSFIPWSLLFPQKKPEVVWAIVRRPPVAVNARGAEPMVVNMMSMSNTMRRKKCLSERKQWFGQIMHITLPSSKKCSAVDRTRRVANLCDTCTAPPTEPNASIICCIPLRFLCNNVVQTTKSLVFRLGNGVVVLKSSGTYCLTGVVTP